MLSPQRCHGKPLEGLLQPFKTLPHQHRKGNATFPAIAKQTQLILTPHTRALPHLNMCLKWLPTPTYKPQVPKDIHTIYFKDDMSSLSSS